MMREPLELLFAELDHVKALLVPGIRVSARVTVRGSMRLGPAMDTTLLLCSAVACLGPWPCDALITVAVTRTLGHRS